MLALWAMAVRAAASDATVLLTGETGTGKGVFARAIHDASPRADRRFEKCNIAALNDNLIEAELFGAARGAYTGCMADRAGRFESANEGTLFLDEIAELPVASQAKILRAIEDKVVERVGEPTERKVSVRIIAATSRDLHERIREGLFREDLYYRLNVVHIHLPPLRERVEEIEPLAEFFLKKCSGVQCSDVQGRTLAPEPLNTSIPVLDPRSVRVLQKHTWPGNVRELEHVIARAVMMANGAPKILPEHIVIPRAAPMARGSVRSGGLVELGGSRTAPTPTTPTQPPLFTVANPLDRIVPMAEWLMNERKRYIRAVVDHCHGDINEASRVLGVRQRTIQRAMSPASSS